MAMLCPHCGTTSEQRLLCPLCGKQMVLHDARRLPAGPPPAARWHQTPWGRILLGLLLAQGLFFGLRHLVTGALLAAWGKEAVEAMGTADSGFFLLQTLRLVSLCAGVVFAGAGQRQGAFLGGMIGTSSGVLSVLWFAGPGRALTPLAVLAQPLSQALVGAAGGWVGSLIWKPLPAEKPVAAPPRPSRFRPPVDLFKGPVAWVRVGLGVTLAVAGTLSATLFFEKVLDVGQGVLAVNDEVQDKFIIMEIKALAILLGGALAGAATRNGLKQGLCVGALSTVVLVGIEMHYLDRWLKVAGLTALCAFSLSAVGGWFGSQLFPPVVRGPRRFGRASV